MGKDYIRLWCMDVMYSYYYALYYYITLQYIISLLFLLLYYYIVKGQPTINTLVSNTANQSSKIIIICTLIFYVNSFVRVFSIINVCGL